MEMLGAFECDHNNSLSQGLFYINADRGLYKVSLLLTTVFIRKHCLAHRGSYKQGSGFRCPSLKIYARLNYRVRGTRQTNKTNTNLGH